MTSHTSPSSFSTPHAGIQGTTAYAANLPADISPSSLDTLPVLTSVLTRLHTTSPNTLNPSASPNPQSQSQSQSQTIAHPPSSAQSQSQSLPSQAAQGSSQPSSVAPSSTLGHSQPHGQNTFATTPLAPKDIPSATDTLKHRLQRARVAVAALPDMERTVREQEEEITDLMERIRLQRDVLERLRIVGAGGERMVE